MHNSLKRFICYLLYAAVFGYIVIKADDYHRYLKQLFSTTFNATYLWLFMSIFPIIVGILIALPHFVTVFKQKGSWQVDWVRLLAVGLPSLIIAVTPTYAGVKFDLLNKTIFFIMALHPSLVTAGGALFGFTLLNSFGKKEKNCSTHLEHFK